MVRIVGSINSYQYCHTNSNIESDIKHNETIEPLPSGRRKAFLICIFLLLFVLDNPA